VAIAHRRVREVVALGIVLAGVLRAFALDPSLDVSQYAHTAWKVRDGFTKGQITSLAQTSDGYLWLGTEFGLMRFDGARAVLWQPPAGQLPGNYIGALLVSRDDTLWIGTLKGLASWKNGKLTTYPELSEENVGALLEDREGTVWVGTISTLGAGGRLCAIRNGSLQCHGEDGSLGPGVMDLFEDSKGNLWVGAQNGFWRWKPGTSEFFSVPGELDGVRFGGDDDGALIIGGLTGLKRFKGGHIEPFTVSGLVQPFSVRRMLRDRDGALWIGTAESGIVHVHQGKEDVFSQADTLTGNNPGHLIEDREGNVWVSTLDGLDRFRPYSIPTISVKQGLSNSAAWTVLAAKDSSVWIGTYNALNRWERGQITVFGRHIGSQNSDGKPIGLMPTSLFQDSEGRVWVATTHEFGYLENDRFVPVTALPGGYVNSIAEVPAGHLWVAYQDAGLFHLFQGRVVQRIPWAGFGHKDPVKVLVADPSQNGLWLGFYQGGVAYFADGRIREYYSSGNGLGEGIVNDLRFGPRGALWVATESGLSRIKDGKVATLTSKNGLPCDSVLWMMEDDDHAFWLLMPCGLVRLTKSELDAWVGDPNKILSTTVFDNSDGVRTRARAGGFTPHVAKSQDGKIRFAAWDGVSVIDPHHLSFNKLPPPVHVEEIIADGKTYDATDGLRLPPLVRDLEIHYTALSLVAPDKIRFRFKLEGQDKDWREVVNRRRVEYSNLPPRNYRFRVSASNNSGVWNEAGTFLDFSVAPAYYQTIWFRSVCVIAFLGLLAALYELRLRQVARQFNMRLEERVNERIRIARDLHDTLLQSFQGVLLKFHAVTYLLPDRAAEAQKNLEAVIEQARAAITEGRDAVQGLRSSALVTNDLAGAITALGEELAACQTDQNSPDCRVHVEGAARNLAPILCDEVYRIAGEALRNAFRHAHATRIEVEIRYDRRQFRVRVRDNGKGIDSKILGGDGRAGHYGLPGMHERAKLVGGRLAVWSEVDSGTELELTIPASVAYAKSAAGSPSVPVGKGA
jgi:signal transduction histidine kinase/ligand-binding sensor domain-containing protein